MSAHFHGWFRFIVSACCTFPALYVIYFVDEFAEFANRYSVHEQPARAHSTSAFRNLAADSNAAPALSGNFARAASEFAKDPQEYR
jgi:hypothetical protein